MIDEIPAILFNLEPGARPKIAHAYYVLPLSIHVPECSASLFDTGPLRHFLFRSDRGNHMETASHKDRFPFPVLGILTYRNRLIEYHKRTSVHENSDPC